MQLHPIFPPMNRVPKVRVTDYRPPGAGRGFSLERDCQPRPGAVACQAAPAKRTKAVGHALMVFDLSDEAIAGIIADAEKRNLRDRKDHEVRFWSERSSAARAIRRMRKDAGLWTLPSKKRISLCGG